MSLRYPAGLINGSPVTAAYPSGVWTPSQTNVYNSQNVWQYDQYWRNTTLLLHGDGTNGAQNNTFLDSSSNNFSITRNGNTTQGAFTPYQPNGYWSNYFNGSNSYLNFSDNTAFNFGTGDATVEFWFNSPGTSNSYPGIISSADYNTSGSASIRFDNTGYKGKVFMYLNGGGDPVISSTSVLAYNTWYHVAITRSGTSMKLYINGNLDTTVTISASLGWYLSYGGLRIGRGFDVDGGSAYFPGYISNVRLVKGSVVYASNFSPSTTPLTAISGTSLLTCQSNRFIDNSSNAFAVTLNNSPSVQAFQPFPGATTWSASVLGGSGYFDGSGDYLNTPSTGQFTAAGDFTVSCWFMLQSFANSYYVVGGNWNPGTSDEWLIQVQNNGAIRFLTSADGTFSAAGVVKLNEWTFFSATRTGSTVTVQVNGTTVRTYTKSDTLGSATKNIYVGIQQGTTWPWNGYIADFRLVLGSAVSTSPTTPLTAVSGTSLLLNFTNASIVDNSMMNDLETVGNAQISTSVKKYGTGSMYFDGSGDYLYVPSNLSNALGTGDFTFECWVNAAATPSDVGIFESRTLSDSGIQNGFTLTAFSSSVIRIFSDGILISSSNTSYVGAWCHVAVVRASGTWTLYINGVSQGTSTAVRNMTNTDMVIGAGRYSSSSTPNAFFNGYIDDLRITRSARYLANFTPQTSQWQDQ